jgi:hypothetical protein
MNYSHFFLLTKNAPVAGCGQKSGDRSRAIRILADAAHSLPEGDRPFVFSFFP